MGYPSWSDGSSTTVQLSVGATTPLVVSTPIPRQVVQEVTDGTMQVVDIGPHLVRYDRTYTGVPFAEFAALVALYEGATVNFMGSPVTWTDEDGTARRVRILSIARTRRDNGDYDLTISMRGEPS